MAKGHSGLSSMKNAYKSRQRTHKERDQPKERQHLGMLEKRKDYKKRALDYQKKRDHIKRLEIKARDKNPDSFYFRMINEPTQNGIHIVDKTTVKTAKDEIKTYHSRLLYLKSQQNILSKKINKLQNRLHFINEADTVQRNHLVFVSDDEQVKNFEPTKYFNTSKEMLSRAHNRARITDSKTTKADDSYMNEIANQDKPELSIEQRQKNYLLLDKYIEKEATIKKHIEDYEIKMNMLKCENTGTKYTVKEDPLTGKKVYRWQFERQK